MEEPDHGACLGSYKCFPVCACLVYPRVTGNHPQEYYDDKHGIPKPNAGGRNKLAP